MSKIFNKHNVRQRLPANINSYKRLATFTSGAGRLSKRRSKRRSVNPALNIFGYVIVFRVLSDAKRNTKSQTRMWIIKSLVTLLMLCKYASTIL